MKSWGKRKRPQNKFYNRSARLKYFHWSWLFSENWLGSIVHGIQQHFIRTTTLLTRVSSQNKSVFAQQEGILTRWVKSMNSAILSWTKSFKDASINLNYFSQLLKDLSTFKIKNLTFIQLSLSKVLSKAMTKTDRL